MGDIRTEFKDFAGYLALRTRKVRRKVYAMHLDFVQQPSLVASNGVAVTVTRVGATATRVNEQGLIEIVAADTPRWDYDPVTKACRGLLVEDTRTNLFLRSEEFDNASWTKSNVTVTANAAAAPDGALTAERVSPTGAVSSYIAQGFAAVNGLTYTVSVFAKADVGSHLIIEMHPANWAVGAVPIFNLANGTVESGPGVIENLGNGWYRCSATGVSIVTGTLYAPFFVANYPTGDAGDSIYLWGAQVEQTTSALSYIPTTSAAVTRNADVAAVSDISGFYNASEGTVVAEFLAHPAVGVEYGPVFEFNDGTSGQRWRGQIDISEKLNHLIYDGVVQVQDFSVASLVAGQLHRAAWAIKVDDFGMSLDGATVVADTSGAMPVVDELSLGVAGGLNAGGIHLRRFSYYRKRLPDATLELLSAPGAGSLDVYEDEDATFIDGLEEDDGLETAVVISLFTDRRANRGDAVPGDPNDRRGWWGDSFADVAGDRIGSRLWLLSREKQMPSVLARALEYAAEALQWLIDDGIARAVNVTAEVVSQGVLGLGVEIVRSGKPAAQYRFETFWKGA